MNAWFESRSCIVDFYSLFIRTNGISLPSFNVKLGRYGSCLGAVPEASGAKDEPMEFIVSFAINSV